jgi:DUF4097 and DUF4098 domain-containing protein YvlB
MNRIALIALGTLLFGGCVIHGTEERAIERFQFDITSPVRLVARIDDGSLEIVGTRSQEIRVTVVKKARGPSAEAAAALLEHIVIDTEQDEETVRLEVKSGSAWKWDDEGFGPRHLQADVEIRVPQQTDLELTTQDGRIIIENIEGRIQAETGDGRVRLRDVTGDIQARTSDGSIIGVGLDGPIDVATDDGRIELEGRFQKLAAITSDGSIKIRCGDETPSPKEDWHIRTSDGSISITLPRDLSAELEAIASDGRIVNELRFTEADEDKHRVKGKLGEGGNLIYVKTSDGRITLRSR